MRKTALMLALVVVGGSAACKKTGEGEYKVVTPGEVDIKTDTHTVRTPTVDVVKDTAAVVTPKVEVRKDTSHVTIPKVRVKKPS